MHTPDIDLEPVAFPETAYGCPGPDARSTELQTLQHEGALEIHEAPLSIDSIIQVYKSRFEEVLGLENREPGSDQEAYVKAETQRSLRQMMIRPLGYRLVRFAYYRAQNDLEATYDRSNRRVGHRVGSFDHQNYYTAQRNRVYDVGSDLVHLAWITRQEVRRATSDTWSSFAPEERLALNSRFRVQTEKTVDAVKDLLDVRYPDWRQLSAWERVDAYANDELPEDEIYWLMKLNVSSDLPVSFTSASVSAAESATVMLSYLHTALSEAGWPEETWLPLSYANLRKLTLPAQLKNKYSNRILHDFADPASANVFSVSRDYDDPEPVSLADSYFNRVYERHSTASCQGAFDASPLDRITARLMNHAQQQIAKRAGRFSLDANVVHATNSAQMLTTVALTKADASVCQLVRSQHTSQTAGVAA